MKTLQVLILVLAGFSMAASQMGPFMGLTPVMIKAKRAVIAKNSEWYQKIDDSQANVYISLYKTFKKIVSPLIANHADLTAACNGLPANSTNLSTSVASTFNAFIGRVDSALSRDLLNNMYGALTMYYRNDPMSMLGQSAHFFQMALSMKFTWLAMSAYSFNETCMLETLSKFVKTYEPYAKEILKKADIAIETMPDIFANLSMTTANAAIEVQALTKKINQCKKSLSMNVCVDQINQQYTVCGNSATCFFEINLKKPLTEISLGMTTLNTDTISKMGKDFDEDFMKLMPGPSLCFF